MFSVSVGIVRLLLFFVLDFVSSVLATRLARNNVS